MFVCIQAQTSPNEASKVAAQRLGKLTCCSNQALGASHTLFVVVLFVYLFAFGSVCVRLSFAFSLFEMRVCPIVSTSSPCHPIMIYSATATNKAYCR